MDEVVLKLVQNAAQLQIHFVDTQLPLCAVISQCMCPRVLSALCQHQPCGRTAVVLASPRNTHGHSRVSGHFMFYAL